MEMGDTYRENGLSLVWARCPACLYERGVRRRGPSPLVLCKDCAKKEAKKMNTKVWYGLWNKGE